MKTSKKDTRFMCLKRAKRINPGEDIKCYKVVEVKPHGNSFRLASPYRDFTYIPGSKYTSLNWTETEEWGARPGVDLRVNGGAYHSMADYAGVGAVIDDIAGQIINRTVELAVIECTIPKTSREVYQGFYLSENGYASTEIHVDRVVPRQELIDELIKNHRKFDYDRLTSVHHVYFPDIHIKSEEDVSE